MSAEGRSKSHFRTMRTVHGMAMQGPPGRRPGLLTLLIAALVAGIFGMHGLVAGVGCSATESSVPAGDRATASSPGMAAMGHASAATGPMTVKDAPSLTASPVHAGCLDMGGMLMLCIAVLTAAAGALLALLALRRLKCAWLRAPRLDGTIVRRLLDYIGAGPPPAWEFSVIRC